MQNQLKQLQDVFARSAFVIPDYQRGYAWTDEHRDDLLTDLNDLDALAATKMHYTGTLVLHRGRHPSKNVLGRAIDVLDIVDGQQRLTSLVVLLSVIARRFEALDSEDGRERARNLRETFIAYKETQKLSPNGEAGRFFRDHVLGDPAHAVVSSPPERELLNARRQFDSFVDGRLAALTDDAARIAWLDRWASLVTTRLGFVVFEVEDEADVGVMFEAMNARGKALTQAELVKNYLLFAAAKVTTGGTLHALTEEVNETWKQVVRILDDADLSDDDDRLMQYHWWIWPSAKGLEGESLSKTSNIHRALKAVIRVADGEANVTRLIRSYLGDLRLAARAFASLMAPRHGKAFAFAGDETAALQDRALGLIRMGRNAVVTPLLMASVIAYADDPPQLLEILRLAETFAFRLALIGSRSNTGESKLMGLAFELRSKALGAAEVQARLRGLIAAYASDKTVERVLLEPDGSSPNGNFYAWGHLPHVLFEYERSLVEAARQKFAHDWESFYVRWRESIEHILPQGEATLKDPYWSARFTPDQWKRSHHRLGNLTLTEWNSSYGNRGFDKKCGAPAGPHDARVYRNSRFYCERELVNVAEWTEGAIEERQKRLAKFVMNRWKA